MGTKGMDAWIEQAWSRLWDIQHGTGERDICVHAPAVIEDQNCEDDKG